MANKNSPIHELKFFSHNENTDRVVEFIIKNYDLMAVNADIQSREGLDSAYLSFTLFAKEKENG